MAIIRIYKDALLGEPECHQLDGATNLLEWLHENKPGIGGMHAIVSVNGGVVADSSKHTDMAERTSIAVGLFDQVDIIIRPADAATIGYLAVALFAAAAAIALAPKPKLPNDVGESSSSPNNQLNAANNEFRQRQAIPDIAGSVVSYPDFLQPSYYDYDGNIKRIYEVFCVGEGRYDVGAIRSGGTELSDYVTYQQGDVLPQLKNVRENSDITGQDLQYFSNVGGGQFGSTSVSEGTLENVSATTGKLTMSNAEFANIGNVSNGDQFNINVDYIPLGGGAIGTYIAQGEFDTFLINPDSTVTLTIINLNGVMPDSDTGTVSGTASYLSSSSPVSRQFYVLDGDNVEQVWFQVVAPQGLRSATGDIETVPITLEVQRIDDLGNDVGMPVQRTVYISGSSFEAQYRTYRIENLTSGRYKAAITRNTIPSDDGDVVDTVKVEDIQSVQFYTPTEFGDITWFRLTRTANANTPRSSSSKINTDVTRKLELFNPLTASYDVGNYTATRSFAQFVMYLMRRAGVPVSRVDYQELFDIENSLSDDQLGYFDFTFDDRNISFESRLETACNVARVKVYEVAGVYKFVREESQVVPSALFCRRNLAPNAARQEFNGYVDNDFDSIELKYIDPVKNVEAYVRRRINMTTGAIEVGLGDSVQEITLAGCRNELQATNRAELEIRRIKYQRYAISDVALSDALNVGVGKRVLWCDINDSKVQSGEILGIDGNIYETSEKIDISGAGTYYVYVTDESGAVSNMVAVDSVPGNEFAFEAFGALTSYTADGYERQLGSMYTIVNENDVNAVDFMLTYRGAQNADGTVEIKASKYDERMFEED